MRRCRIDRPGRRTRARWRRSRADYDSLGERLARRGIDIEAVKAKVARYGVAVPSWGVGTGGTRFARFPGEGEPRHIFDKLEDCAVIQQLTRATPTVCLHIPWDKVPRGRTCSQGQGLGLGFDAVNSNTFQDQPGQALSYKFGSLSHADAAVRAQAVAHNVECIEIGRALGSKALTVWIGDGSNFPGRPTLPARSTATWRRWPRIYAALPDDWRVFIEHKMYEPAFYSTVVADWGTNYLIATELGPQGVLPCRPRPPCAQREHRDDRARLVRGEARGFQLPVDSSCRSGSRRACRADQPRDDHLDVDVRRMVAEVDEAVGLVAELCAAM